MVSILSYQNHFMNKILSWQGQSKEQNCLQGKSIINKKHITETEVFVPKHYARLEE